MKAPELEKMTTPELLDQLKSGERWNRTHARRVLADRPTDEVISATAKWAESADARGLIDAIGIYETHEVVEPVLLQEDAPVAGLPGPRLRDARRGLVERPAAGGADAARGASGG